MSSESLLDEILDDYRDGLREAIKLGHSRTHYMMSRLQVHRRLQENWPSQEVDQNRGLIVELLDQIEHEMRRQEGQTTSPPPIDWKAVGQEIMAVAENLGWKMDIQFHPERQAVYLKVDSDTRDQIEPEMDRFKERIQPRLPNNVFQRVTFRLVPTRQAPAVESAGPTR